MSQISTPTIEEQGAVGLVGSSDLLGDSERPKVISWFSCGAASAVATKLAIAKYGAVEIYYTDPGSEHPDNVRFRNECEAWFGQPVTVLRSEKYADTWAVWDSKQYLVDVKRGAPCTLELKRKIGRAVLVGGETEIYGYTREEADRIAQWKAMNFERKIECPLMDRDLGKEDCFGILARIGIELPAMYKLGFRNNNCIACVKARDSLDYWKRIRKHFPVEFGKMAANERKYEFALNRRTTNGERTPVFLDEIEAGDPTGPDPQISCGLFCMAEADGFSSPNTESSDAERSL